MQVALAGGLTFVSTSPSILTSLTRVSNVPHGLVRTVVEKFQSFLTAELLTLKQLSTGVQVRVADMTEEDAGHQDVELPRLEYHTEDKDDDLLMDDYDVGLLGREYVLTLPAIGLRMTRSPCGSADNEHKAKRAQHQPLSQDGSSTPSALSMPSLTS
ncbi:hypothetical protein PC123_g26512 [Phytophthora cactorum]|nr:hypothetical protein PC123_g26512 [Phytophthora cactorum]